MAQEKARELVHSYEFIFRRRYNLPPTDPRFLNATQEEIETDYWAHWYTDHPNEANAVLSDDPDFDLETIKAKMEAGADPKDWEEI